ncbi:hypothetical protein RUM44_005951 [Polyplax serrata]|uniref:Tropomyosin n=1 Tax=Polyplax serrata TaxID=468196 RepID=A0ABR1AYM7_POLSC
MDAIKKKMQAMKLEKDNAMDRAQMCEQQAKDANLRAEKAEEEARSLQKKIQQIENELDQTQEQLMQVNAKLEEKDKALQNVSVDQITLVSSCEGPTVSPTLLARNLPGIWGDPGGSVQAFGPKPVLSSRVRGFGRRTLRMTEQYRTREDKKLSHLSLGKVWLHRVYSFAKCLSGPERSSRFSTSLTPGMFNETRGEVGRPVAA